MIKAVVFDLDNTLYNFDKHHQMVLGPLAQMAHSKYGVNPEEFTKAYYDSMDEMAKNSPFLYSGLHSRAVRFTDICSRMGIPVIPNAADLAKMYWNILLMGLVPEPHVIELMHSLRDQQIKIGLGTNMTAYIQYRKLERIGIRDEIEYFITSEESAYEKPQDGFFQYVIKKLGVDANEILFIGDDMVNDILPALKNGMQAMWYTRCLSPEKIEAAKKLAAENKYQILEYASKLPNVGDYEKSSILHINDYWTIL